MHYEAQTFESVSYYAQLLLIVYLQTVSKILQAAKLRTLGKGFVWSVVGKISVFSVSKDHSMSAITVKQRLLVLEIHRKSSVAEFNYKLSVFSVDER